MRSFYRFVITFRRHEACPEVAMLAEHIFLDHAFPRQSIDYHEISSYLEMNGDYLLDMSLFDEVWEMYLDQRGTRMGSV